MQVQGNNHTNGWNLVYQGDLRTYTVPNLLPNTTYLFRVRYQCLHGLSPFTKAKQSRTLTSDRSHSNEFHPIILNNTQFLIKQQRVKKQKESKPRKKRATENKYRQMQPKQQLQKKQKQQKQITDLGIAIFLAFTTLFLSVTKTIMSSFSTTIIVFISFIAMNNGQYVNCTEDLYYYHSDIMYGDFYSSFYDFSTLDTSCYHMTMDCFNDCTIDCIGRYVCYGATINGGNGNVIVNCIGNSACLMTTINGENGNISMNCNGVGACGEMDINAINATGLQVNGYGGSALAHLDIACPQNKFCNITANGSDALSYARIIGSIGTKLIINSAGEWVMASADIYCPPDHI
eukprot:152717_1